MQLRVIRYFLPMVGLLGVLAPVLARAQTNLDQGKSASQIFASACAECHKAAHGLAHGKNVSTLAGFLQEHYTTNSQQAAALAAYVLGGSGASPIGALPGRGQKAKTHQADAEAEEAKPSKPHVGSKPEEGKPANSRLRHSTHEAAKPKDEANPEQPSIAAPEQRGKSRHRPALATRGRAKEPKTPLPPPEPAVVTPAPAASAEPMTAEPPKHSAGEAANPAETPSAAAVSAPAASGEEAPVPRDNIPD
jgi:hypothetical protein